MSFADPGRLAVLLSLAAVFACSPRAQPSVRDTLIFGTSADIMTLDPHETIDNYSDQIILMAFNGLLRFDDRLKITPDLAASWSVGPDQRTWTFILRQGVRFHDGTPFTADAVVRNFARVMNPGEHHKRLALFDAFERVEAVDDFTVRIVTKRPFASFEQTIAHVSASIVNPTTVRQYGLDFGKSAETTSGTGPFRIARWEKGKEVVLERNDDYWDEKPSVTRVVYRQIPEAASRVLALETGEVDVIHVIPPTDMARLERNPDVSIQKVPSVGAQEFLFHARRPFFLDPRVRRAVSMGIDRRALIDHLLPGLAIRTTGPLTVAMRGRANLGEIRYAPAEARRLLAEAGYANRLHFKINTTPRFTLAVELAEAIASQLKLIGVTTEIVVEDSGTFFAYAGVKPEDNPKDFSIMRTGASSGDADWGLRNFFTTQPTNHNNYAYYSNREFDDLVLKAMWEMDATRRNAMYRRAQEILYLEDPAAVWLFDLYEIIGVRRNVTGVSLSPFGVATFERARLQ